MYSYYDKNEITPIPKIYYEIMKYLIENQICKKLDFEGSVFPEIENFNLSLEQLKKYISIIIMKKTRLNYMKNYMIMEKKMKNNIKSYFASGTEAFSEILKELNLKKDQKLLFQ